MLELIFPPYKHRIEKRSGGLFIYDEVRKKFVFLTPEEWVRQHLVHFLINEKSYSRSRIAIEKEWKLNGKPKRTDLLVYDDNGSVEILAELKNAAVPLGEEAMKQVLVYNKIIRATYIVLTNGKDLIVYDYDQSAYLKEIPVNKKAGSNK